MFKINSEKTKRDTDKPLNCSLILVCVGIVILTACLVYSRSNLFYQSCKGSQIEHVQGFIYKEKSCSDKEVKLLKTLTDGLPKVLMNKFKDKHGKVIIVKDLKGDCVGDTNITRNNITVYIKEGYVFDILIHEFGHIYLHYNPMDKEFEDIYKTEAKSLVKAYYGDEPYYYTDKTEFYAQAFQTVYCMRGKDTQKAAPKTFKYMTNVLNHLYDSDK